MPKAARAGLPQKAAAATTQAARKKPATIWQEEVENEKYKSAVEAAVKPAGEKTANEKKPKNAKEAKELRRAKLEAAIAYKGAAAAAAGGKSILDRATSKKGAEKAQEQKQKEQKQQAEEESKVAAMLKAPASGGAFDDLFASLNAVEEGAEAASKAKAGDPAAHLAQQAQRQKFTQSVQGRKAAVDVANYLTTVYSSSFQANPLAALQQQIKKNVKAGAQAAASSTGKKAAAAGGSGKQ